MAGHSDPEAAARDGDSPATIGRTVLVDVHPAGHYAVVLIEYNEPPSVEPYTVLCHHDDDGWHFAAGGSGWGGWYWTGDTEAGGGTGVEVTEGESVSVRWDAPEPKRGP